VNNYQLKSALSWVVVAMLAVSAQSTFAGGKTDLSDMEDGTRALLAKERARQTKPSDKDTDKTGASKNNTVMHKDGVKGGCDMNVGNNQPKPGHMNSKPQTVIITGPVIQNCK
jgi:hypothetical protein